jgi:cytochrome d ubiquinol oxidase subunit II
MRAFWDYGFFIGSIVIAVVQGAAVGRMIEGIEVTNNQYSGSLFAWLRPFPLLTGIGLVLGYALLGAGWLVLKCEGELRDWTYRRIPWLAAGVFIVLAVAFALVLDKIALAHSNLSTRQWGLVFPALGIVALASVVAGALRRRDGVPFAMTALFFIASFLTLGVMFWPFMIPYTITVANAAAPDASLRFLFYGAGLVALPIVIVYTIGVYWIFRGKGHQGYH